jgi:serine/threonine protein phosphatase PrpC
MNFISFGKKVLGASHDREKMPCQDSFYCTDYMGSYIFAVADGHGSANCKYSDVGSNKAVIAFSSVMHNLLEQFEGNQDAFHAYLSRNRNDIIPKKIFLEWEENIKIYHHEVHKDEVLNNVLYGTTLLGLMVCPNFYFAVQIGDGDILAVYNQGNTQLVIESEKILGTETLSLSSKDAWKYFLAEIRYLSDKEEFPALFMLSTDGMSNSFASEDAFLSCGKDYFDLLKKHGRETVEDNLEEWLNEITLNGCGDDIAIILAIQDKYVNSYDAKPNILANQDEHLMSSDTNKKTFQPYPFKKISISENENIHIIGSKR